MTTDVLTAEQRRLVIREALSVGIATGPTASASGPWRSLPASTWQACALSLLMFTGGSQFAFIGIISAGLHAAPAAIAASSLLGVRNGLYALELTQLLGCEASDGWPPRTSPSTSRPRSRCPSRTTRPLAWGSG